MKKNLLKTVAIFLLILCSIFSYAAQNNNTNNDDEYFSVFRKNEDPKNKSFKIVLGDNININKVKTDFYTIYKEDSEGKGYYFKVVVDKKTQKPIATYIAENQSPLSAETKSHLIYISKEVLNIKSIKDVSLVDADDKPAICVIKCHRANNCYGKETSLGASLCSAECHLSCHRSTSISASLTESIE